MVPTEILGKYRITYSNGVIQVCDLISQEAFNNDIQSTKDRIYDLKIAKDTSGKIERLQGELKGKYGTNYFTDESPIYKAVETGILVVNNYSAPCKVEKL